MKPVRRILGRTLLGALGALVAFVLLVLWVNLQPGEDPAGRSASLPDEITPAYTLGDAWWKYTSVYQIYPRSFQDSDGDGIGDLQGVIDRLDYVASMGFETVWLSPFFTSPQRDHGYDVGDYRNVAPEYGTLETVDRLIQETHDRGLRIVFDLVLNHTSDQHPWFLESRSGRDNPRSDWYVWRDGVDGGPPNNWQNIPSSGSAWTYVEERDQWYYAAFLPFQPDLNMHNPAVQEAILDVVRFWLNRGVDGFRLDIFNFVFEDPSYPDNPRTLRALPDMVSQKWMFEERRFNMNRPENFAFAKRLRAVIEEYDDPKRFVVGEVFGGHDVLRRLLGEERFDGLNLVFLFDFLDRFGFEASFFREQLEDYERFYPEPYVPAYVFSNHDQFRSVTRLGDDREKAKLLAFFQLTVRGAAFTYQGEEIGMTTGHIPVEEGQDPLAEGWTRFPAWFRNRLPLLLNRDNSRTPMQWSAADNAGFADPGVQTWLPVQPNYPDINVASSEDDPSSLLHVYRTLLHFKRGEPALHEGSLEILEGDIPRDVLAYVRRAEGQEVLAILNFSAAPKSMRVPDDRFRSAFYSIAPEDRVEGGTVSLSPFGGVLIEAARTSPDSLNP